MENISILIQLALCQLDLEEKLTNPIVAAQAAMDLELLREIANAESNEDLEKFLELGFKSSIQETKKTMVAILAATNSFTPNRPNRPNLCLN